MTVIHLGEAGELGCSIRMLWRLIGLEVLRLTEPLLPEKAQQWPEWGRWVMLETGVNCLHTETPNTVISVLGVSRYGLVSAPAEMEQPS